MKAFFGETPEEQEEYLKKTLFEGTQDVLQIVDQNKQIEMLLVVTLLSENVVNKSDEDEPGFRFFTKKCP